MTSDVISTEQIWKQLSTKLRLFFLKRVSNEQAAEDLLQETFLRIHRRLGDVDDEKRLTSWVFQIARNLVVDHYRAKGKSLEVSMSHDPEATPEEEENLNELVSSWFPKMISLLPEGYREAVELYELEKVPQQEIADRLSISLSGAKSRVQRGREKLKSILFDCCTFEKDVHGNIIAYAPNDPDSCPTCDDGCDS